MNVTSTLETQLVGGNASGSLKSKYTYEAALSASERVNWRIGDIIGGTRSSTSQNPLCPNHSLG
jgi:hypothetical protein